MNSFLRARKHARPCKGCAQPINNTREKPWSPSPHVDAERVGRQVERCPHGRPWEEEHSIRFAQAAGEHSYKYPPRANRSEGASPPSRWRDDGERRERKGSLAGRPCLLCAASLDKLKSCKSSSRLPVCKSRLAAPPSGAPPPPIPPPLPLSEFKETNVQSAGEFRRLVRGLTEQ